tara:strand:- start:851 stop:1039 length:189 start_codon:yes stop_codon:yes gene_type:complete
MNKEKAINILLDFAKNYNKDWYAADKDGLTAAIIFLEQDQKKNKKDAKVEIEGLEFKLTKGA